MMVSNNSKVRVDIVIIFDLLHVILHAAQWQADISKQPIRSLKNGHVTIFCLWTHAHCNVLLENQ